MNILFTLGLTRNVDHITKNIHHHYMTDVYNKYLNFTRRAVLRKPTIDFKGTFVFNHFNSNILITKCQSANPCLHPCMDKRKRNTACNIRWSGKVVDTWQIGRRCKLPPIMHITTHSRSYTLHCEPHLFLYSAAWTKKNMNYCFCCVARIYEFGSFVCAPVYVPSLFKLVHADIAVASKVK